MQTSLFSPDGDSEERINKMCASGPLFDVLKNDQLSFNLILGEEGCGVCCRG